MLKWVLVVTLLNSKVMFVYSDHHTESECIDQQQKVSIVEPTKIQCMTWEEFQKIEYVVDK